MKRNRLALFAILAAIPVAALIYKGRSKKTVSTPPPVAQAIPASFSIGSTGDATFSYEIVVPPGTNNIQPSLSLEYISGGGNGMLGEGFDLKGLSEITRAGATVAQDGYKGGVSYAATDRFSIDGNRLMLVNGSSYGAAGTTYHTQLESWTKVVAVGQSGAGPQSFQVWTKNGNYFEYGATADSRITAIGAPFNSGAKAGSVRQWLVNKFSDLDGNTLTINYTQTPADSNGNALAACNGQGTNYPSRIAYTSNASTPALRSVQFVYEARPDSATCWLGGGSFSMRARMSAIRTWVKDGKGDSTMVREVRFRYQSTTPLSVSRIGTLQVRAGETGYAPTTFQWSEGQNTLVSTPVAWNGPQNNSGLEGDFNGDGKTDLLAYTGNFYLGADSGFAPAANSGVFLSTSQNNFIGDYNGDGLSDLLIGGTTSGTIYYYANGKFQSPGKVVQGLSISGGCYPAKCVWQGDFNGDGLTDVASCESSTGSFNFGDATAGLLPAVTQKGMSIYMGATYAADFNGDGLADLFSCSSSTGYLTFSNFSDSTGFRPPVQINGMSFSNSGTNNTWVGDYNGDGMADLLAKGGDGKYRVYYATGTGFTPGKQIANVSPSTVAVWPSDFNNDGLLDFYAAAGNSGTVFLCNGIDFSNTETINAPFAANNTWLGDFNGDGLTDLFNATISSGTAKMYYGGNSAAPRQHYNQAANYLVGVDNGIGSAIAVKYYPITDSTVYKPGNSTGITGVEGQRMLNEFSSFPLSAVQNPNNSIISIQSALYVVSAWSQTDGKGNTYSWSYDYTGARYDMTGYGFLGFYSVAENDPQQGSVSTTVYNQPFPLTGRVNSSQLKTSAGQILQSATSTWQSSNTTYGANAIVTSVRNTAQDNYGYYNGVQGSHTNKLFYYDAYGNCRLTRNMLNVANPQATWTRCTFDNNTTSWQLGYLTSAVQSADSSGTNPLSASRVFYSQKRHVDSLQTWFSQDNSWLTKSFVYDGFGNQTCAVSYAGDSTLTVFDSTYHSFPVLSISPPNANGLKLQERSRYEPFYGNKTWTQDANNNQFTKVYDALGRFKSMEIPGASGTPLTALTGGVLPDATGYIEWSVQVRDWNGTVSDTTWNYFDALGRNYKTQQRGWNGQLVETVSYFNSNGQTTKASLPYFVNQQPVWGRMYYDAAGRTIRTSTPFETGDSLVNRIWYGAFSVNVTQASNKPDSTVSGYVYNLYNGNSRVVSFVNEAGQTSQFTWDLLARITSATDPGGIKTGASWNSLSRNSWYYSTSFDTLLFQYNPEARQVQTTNALGEQIGYTYDALGRVLTTTATGASPITYQYDDATHANGLNNLCAVTMDNGKSQYSFAYDALGNTTQATVGLDGHIWNESTVFNPDFSLASLQFPDGTAEIFNYNTAGQSTGLQRKNANGATANVLTVNQLNALDEWQSYSYANGVNTLKQYFGDGSLKAFKAFAASGNALLAKSLDWTSHHRVHSLTDSLQSQMSEVFAYNPTGRLLNVSGNGSTATMVYDVSGNLAQNDSVVFTYTNYAVQTGTKNNAAYFSATYDACGQVLTRTLTDHGAAKNFRYSWDAFGRMDSVYRNDTLLYSYTYDFNGNRNRKRDVKEQSVSYSLAGNYTSVFTQGGAQENSASYGLGGSVFATFTGDSALYYHYDQNGSALLVTNQNGAVFAGLSYSPYGKQLSTTGKAAGAKYQFNGQPWEEGAELYYFSSRYYDPVTGRFVSPDDQLGGALITPDALNNYAFVLNSPVTLSDPSGHAPTGTIAEVIIDATVVATGVAIDVVTEGEATEEEAAVTKDLIVVQRKARRRPAATATATSTETKGKSSLLKKRPVGDNYTDENVQPTRSRPSRDAKRKSVQLSKGQLEEEFLETGPDVEVPDEVDEYTDATGKRVSVPRPGLRQGVVETVWNNSSVDGKVLCPNTKKELTWNVSVSRIEQWHMGHREGYEYRYLYKAFSEERISWNVVKAEYNDASHYIAEDPVGNRSHQFEDKNGRSQYWFDTGGPNPYSFSLYFRNNRDALPPQEPWYSTAAGKIFPAFIYN